MMKKISFFFLALVVLFLCSIRVNAEEIKIITNRQDFITSLSTAKNGDTLYVGDIDFSLDSSLAKAISRNTVSKSITIKGAKEKGNSTLTNASFILSGTKVAGEKITVHFENILFDGAIDGAALTDASWAYDTNEDFEPSWVQYAMLFKGNVDAIYKNCVFQNYASLNGGAFVALYGDYDLSSKIGMAYGNNSVCQLNVLLESCIFKDNYTMYGGGAIYIEGHEKNVSFEINNTAFTGNKAGCLDYCSGGGAIFAKEAILDINGSSFKNNIGSYSYGYTIRDCADIPDGMPPEFLEEYLSSIPDQSSGGAICLEYSEAKIKESSFIENEASLGGGLSLIVSSAEIDGCVFNLNQANCDVLRNSEADKGPWSSMGLGGGIYFNSSNGLSLNIYNSSFYKNTARNGYGAMYIFYTGALPDSILVSPIVNLYLCTFYDNKTEVIYPLESDHVWKEIPGYIFDIPFLNTYASIFVDETILGQALPSEDNNYCFFDVSTDCITFELIDNGFLKYNSSISMKLPDGYLEKKLGKRYYVDYSTLEMGSSYQKKMYTKPEEEEPSIIPIPITPISPAKTNDTNQDSFIAWMIISISFAVVLCSGIGVILYMKFKKKKVNSKEEDLGKEEVVIESKEEIVEISNEELLLNIVKEYELTQREKDVLKYLLDGKKRQEIASELFLSESAIKKYTSQIYTKLGVHSKLDLFMKFKNKK